MSLPTRSWSLARRFTSIRPSPARSRVKINGRHVNSLVDFNTGNLEITAVHSPYVVEMNIVARGGKRNTVFLREEVRHLAWRLDPFDSKTLILTRDGVDDSFTFKERKRAGEWIRALEAWAAWSPL